MLNNTRKNEKEKIIIYNNITTSFSNYSDESIRDFLNIEESEIRTATIKMLSTYKERLLGIVDTAIERVSSKSLNYAKTPKN